MAADPRRTGVGRRTSKPLGALASQAIVAASSLVLQFIALRQLGATGLGSFSLLFGILVTVNSIQSGWIGDSLTVLDRFEPGMRRALLESQFAVVIVTMTVTTLLALPVGGVDGTTAVLFGFASVAWVVEETLRRLLIARREFWKLVVNDASFAVGSLSLVGWVYLTDTPFSLQTLVLALLAGAVVAVGVGAVQLPRVELSRGLLGPSQLRSLSSFAFWRAAQVGLRPGSQAAVRAIVAAVVSLEALGQLETARLLLAPVLTAVNGAGVYLLPTYSEQARRGRGFRPRVPVAMAAVGAMAGAYGLVAVALRPQLVELLTDGTVVVTVSALVAWSVYSIGFGLGIPAGNAMVATGRSRTAFRIRCLDAATGVLAATAFAAFGWVDLVPLGLAAGTLIGAALLLATLRPSSTVAIQPPDPSTRSTSLVHPPPVVERSDTASVTAAEVTANDESTWIFEPVGAAVSTAATTVPAPLPPPRPARARPNPLPTTAAPVPLPSPAPDVHAPRRSTMHRRLLWIVPLVMIVATEYKIRRRSIDDALSGSIDPMIAIELLLYGVIGAWAIWRLAPRRLRLTPITVIMWGYVLSTAVSALYAAFPLLAMARAVQLVIIGAVVHLLATDGGVTTVRRFLHGWIVLMSVSILAGLAYVAPTTGPQEGRFTWLSVHSVTTGSMLAISVCVLFGLWLSSASSTVLPWSRSVYGALFAFQMLFLLMTRTRGSIGGAFVALAVMAWVWSGTRMKPQLLLGSVVGIGALVLTFGAPILDYLTRGESAESIGTFNRRTEIWTLAWESFLDRPLHGLGFTSAKGVFFDETGLGGAHNAFVNVMIDVGLVGLVWWCALLVGVIVVLNRQWARRSVAPGRVGAVGTARADHLVMLGIIVASLVNSITTEGLGAGVNVAAIWWFLLAAWLVVLDRPATDDD